MLTFFLNLCRLEDDVEIYDTARQTTEDNIIRGGKNAIWLQDN
jgi:hypothetical protein